MGRRFKRKRMRRGGGASSSMKTLECPICHAHVPLNEYKAHIINCREKSSSGDSNSESIESIEDEKRDE